jgi:hypothetical protein
VALSLPRSRIHELTISLRFLGIILRVLRFEVSLYNVYIKEFGLWIAKPLPAT